MRGGARRSTLGLILLGMLSEEPMHAYRLQKLMLQRGKQRVVNIRQRASVYQAIERLLRLGLVRVQHTVKSGRHPDSTVYAITERGRQLTKAWLGETLRATDPFPEFVAGLSMLTALTPDEARQQLELRAAALADELADVEATIRDASATLTTPPGPTAEPHLARLFLIEEEYRRALLTAQLEWLNGVIDDLRAGRLSWDFTRLREFAAAFEESQE